MLISWVLFGVFVVCVAMLWNEGLWGNAVTLVNATLAALVATNYFEPAAVWLEGQIPSYTYFVDFLSLWAIFAVVFFVLRAVTDQLSKYHVRFKMPVEHVGRILLATWVGWVMVCFTDMSLHTAPLARDSFRGSFQIKPESGNFFFGLSPSRQWLALMQSRSRGALSRDGGQYASLREEDRGRRVFDPNGEFMFKYGYRRELLNEYNEKTGLVRVNP